MDILRILEEKGTELYPCDLNYYEKELRIAPLDGETKARCRALIAALRKQRTAAAKAFHTEVPPQAAAQPEVPCPIPDPNPKPILQEEEPLKTPEQISRDLSLMRVLPDYKTAFKTWLENNPGMDEDFFRENLNLFNEWEQGTILTLIPFSEPFLQQFFDVLDPKIIARCQRFSEKFFMSHYAALDAWTVLTKGVNDWRKPAARSAQLKAFLRLKGCKL